MSNSKENKEKKVKKINFLSSIKGFFRDVRSELKKVTYPSRKQVINNTVIVLVVCIVFSIFVWSLDLGFSAVSKGVLGRHASGALEETMTDGDYKIDENGQLVPNKGVGVTVDEDGNMVMDTEGSQ